MLSWMLTYCGDHFSIYANSQSCCTPETNMPIASNFFNKFKCLCCAGMRGTDDALYIRTSLQLRIPMIKHNYKQKMMLSGINKSYNRGDQAQRADIYMG